jgi:hypothetical protein
MKKKFMIFSMVLVFAFAGVSANAVTWNFYDFGANEFDEHNNTSDVYFPDHGWVPSPDDEGEGGERYDIEGLNFAFDDNFIYVTLTNSYGFSTWSDDYSDWFAGGDVFFGFDGSYFDYAISMDGHLYQVDTYSQIPDKAGTYYHNVSIRNYIDAFQVTGGTQLGAYAGIMTPYPGYEPNPILPGNGDTFVFEFMFSKDMLGVNLNDYTTINFHNTVECGNDLLRKDYTIIPEPGTLMLLGLGLLGVGAGLRRRK